MAKKEYYDRILSSLQSELTSQKAEISELKSAVVSQQKEIEALKASQAQPQKFPIPQRLSASDKLQLLQQVKKECATMIQTSLEMLSSQYATKRELDSFRATISKTYLPAAPFATYKRSQDSRLKIIEEQLNRGFSLFLINRRNQPPNQPRKATLSITAIIQFFHNPQWLIRILVSLSIGLLAYYLYGSIDA